MPQDRQANLATISPGNKVLGQVNVTMKARY